MDTSRYFWNSPGDDESMEPAVSLETPVRVGLIGLGGMGLGSLKSLLDRPAEIMGLCDVDADRVAAAAGLVAEAASAHPECGTTADFRELCERTDIEALVVSTPDHWHVDIAIAAMEAGKDVYVEKPLSLTIAGGRRLVEVAGRTGRILQTGSQQRSSAEFRRACELIRNGAIGRVREVTVTLPPNNVEPPVELEPVAVRPVFDHDMWLGPAPHRDYHPSLCHYNFRFISDYSGGQLTNWGAHHLDIVQWALGMDESGPREVTGRGEFHPTGPFDTAIAVDVTFRYAGGVSVHCRTIEGPSGVEFRGDEGWIEVGRRHLSAEPGLILERPARKADVALYRSNDHYLNFLECVRTRRQPVAPAEVGHRSATVCHLGNIAIKLGRSLHWDPVAEHFPGDEEANSLLDRPGRSDWRHR